MGLSIIGYQAGLEIQSETTLFGLKAFMFLVPAVAMTLCFLLYKFMWTLGEDSQEAEPQSPQESMH